MCVTVFAFFTYLLKQVWAISRSISPRSSCSAPLRSTAWTLECGPALEKQ